MKIGSRVFFWIMTCAALHAGVVWAQIPGIKTQAELEADVATRVLPRVLAGPDNAIKTEEALQAIGQNAALQELVKSGDPLATTEAALAGAGKSLFYDHRYGANPAELGAAVAEDIERISTEFAQCQPFGHQFEQIMQEPYLDVGPCYAKVIFPGVPSGLCGYCVPTANLLCGGCFWILGDLVDYAFPTFKISTSEQPYQSVYLEEDAVKSEYQPGNEAMMAVVGSSVALDNIDTVQKIAKRDLALSGVNVPLSQAPAVLPDDINASQLHLAPSLRTTVPDSSRIYTRNIGEPLNLKTAAMWWIPHIPVPHHFGSDLPPFLTLASRSIIPMNINNFSGSMAFGQLMLSSLSPRTAGLGWISVLASPTLAQKFIEYAQAGSTLTCVSANKRRGKTAIDLLVPGGFADDEELCLKNVGERFPLSDTRRVSITDRTWRGIAKDLDLFQAAVPEIERQSFDEKKDRMLVLRNEKLRLESPGCRPLAEMTRVNTDYLMANNKTVKSGGENAVEVFTKFRGCWGFKGVDESFWTTVVSWDNNDPFRLK